ncbi:hypothetical protein WJX74_002649 [Apatococcus lobatus]|uniref:PRP1 splicing factor N-terminal domain-containing protein n=2 Tax=Apatococcus TaxID=904362 RepID=A0AAW1SXW9_9CHLO
MTSVQRAMPVAAPPGVKVDFNSVPAPANYVPGLGRGATGFTTRSDIGPARMAPGMPSEGGEQAGPAPPSQAQLAQAQRNKEENEDTTLDDSKFDEFMGNDAGALANTGEYDQDDKDADDVWAQIDSHMDNRRRERRESRLKDEIEKYRIENPKITEQFADIKRKLAEISNDEWEGIPDIGDYSMKNKNKRPQFYSPAPDSLLATAAARNEKDTSIGISSSLDGLKTPAGGLETPGGATTNLTEIGKGRRTVIGLNLDRMADSVNGQTVVDPKGYLTDLKSMKLSSDAEIGDIKRARTLLKSVTNTNPKHAPGWVAAARLEELAGKLAEARQLLQRGCELCPTSEDIWLESARLQSPENGRAILARGVAAIPTSVKLWLQASRLEADDRSKSRVLRKALEKIPTSVRLWKAAVELVNEDDARIMLNRAVECCPQHTELWLALARLESYENSKKVLNRARQAIPTEPAIWITAAKLEEAQGNAHRVVKLIENAIKSLANNSVVIDRDSWLKEAEGAERSQPPLVATCHAIVAAVIGLGIEDMDRKRTWVADAEEMQKRGSIETARAILAHARDTFKTKKGLWRRSAQLEKAHGTHESLDALLRDAVKYCPQAEVLWLMAAKEQWLGGHVDVAREILSAAFAANPDSEGIWLAAFKLEFENREPERARALLARARDNPAASTPRVWMKSAVVERELGDHAAERRLLLEAMTRFPDFDKLHLMLGQLEERQNNLEAARQAFQSGRARCMHSIALWRAAATLEWKANSGSRARALLEQARLKNAANEHLWLAAVRTEQQLGGAGSKGADALMARALQECPTSGLLWAEAVAMAPRPQRRNKSVDALKRCNDDPHIIAAVAQLFWNDRKVDKARSWFNRSVTLAADLGDFWAQYYKFEVQHGTPEQQQAVVARCVAAEPHHGERWQRISKNPVNAHMPVMDILDLVVRDLDRPAPV